MGLSNDQHLLRCLSGSCFESAEIDSCGNRSAFIVTAVPYYGIGSGLLRPVDKSPDSSARNIVDSQMHDAILRDGKVYSGRGVEGIWDVLIQRKCRQRAIRVGRFSDREHLMAHTHADIDASRIPCNHDPAGSV